MDYFINPPTESESMYKELKIIENTEEKVVIYSRIKLPLLTDRDSVM